MPRADHQAAVEAVLADHFPEPEPAYRGEYYCPTCSANARDNRAYPCAVVAAMAPFLPKRMIEAAARRRAKAVAS